MVLFQRSSESLIVRASVVLLCVLIMQTQAYSQQTQGVQSQETVKLNVLVTDSSKRPVSNIKQEQFHVFDNKLPQSISSFSNESPPLLYGIVIDNSASFKSVIKPVIESAKIIISGNNINDETYVIRFVDREHIEVVKDVTSDKAALLSSLDTLYIGDGQTAIIDAVYLAATRAAEYKKDDSNTRRRALILVTDGEDRESYYRKEQLIDFLQKENIEVFVIGIVAVLDNNGGLVRRSPRERAINLLNSIAKETGGLAFFPKSPDDLQRVAGEIMLYLRTQYIIGYTPSGKVNKDGLHKVSVEIANAPGHEKDAAITRAGYKISKPVNKE